MLDRYKRSINYLRVSVTDRCNLRCVYCMPAEGIVSLPHDKILSFEEITEVVREAVSLGVDKVRITGGEPLVRRHIVKLISMISAISGINDFSMTTNGTYLENYAVQLRAAGLHRINISLDTLDEGYFRQITRGGELNDVLRGIEAAENAGLSPIKLNCVIKKSPNEFHARKVAKFGKERGYQVRFIREMSLSEGKFWVVIGGAGGDCKHCNRIRLTSDGKILPCLFNDLAFDVRKMGIREAIIEAIRMKPESGMAHTNNEFSKVGG